ncbi:uncharacterized protein [Anomalospiza imberbis]|uniref:uncharacterized protein n=1 Tax=Anomalospiza imberbis TaxID=187417 RepID=UPI00358EB6E3
MTEKTERLSHTHTHTWTHRTPAGSDPEHPSRVKRQLSAPAPLQRALSRPSGYVHDSFPVRTPAAQRYCCCTGGGGRTPPSCRTAPARQRPEIARVSFGNRSGADGASAEHTRRSTGDANARTAGRAGWGRGEEGAGEGKGRARQAQLRRWREEAESPRGSVGGGGERGMRPPPGRKPNEALARGRTWTARGREEPVFESSLVILCGSCQAWGTLPCLELLHISKLRTARVSS